jgi:hypothetical protein
MSGTQGAGEVQVHVFSHIIIRVHSCCELLINNAANGGSSDGLTVGGVRLTSCQPTQVSGALLSR